MALNQHSLAVFHSLLICLSWLSRLLYTVIQVKLWCAEQSLFVPIICTTDVCLLLYSTLYRLSFLDDFSKEFYHRFKNGLKTQKLQMLKDQYHQNELSPFCNCWKAVYHSVDWCSPPPPVTRTNVTPFPRLQRLVLPPLRSLAQTSHHSPGYKDWCSPPSGHSHKRHTIPQVTKIGAPPPSGHSHKHHTIPQVTKI